jgi:alpha-tubulin suppressor-like RCC1 family protein
MWYTLPSSENGVITGQGDSFVANVPRPLPTLAALGIVQVACGESHNAALTIHGRVFTWGRGKYGALGLGTFDSSSWPQHVAALQEPACQVTFQPLPVINCLSMLCLP